MPAKWKLEDDVNAWVIGQLEAQGLERNRTYSVESAMSGKLKAALAGGAKTATKTNFGKPDFEVECYQIDGADVPVLIEDKLSLKKLKYETKEGLKMDDKSVSAYAMNGALHYAQCVIDSGSYDEVVIIGVAGDSEDNVTFEVGYVFSSSVEPKMVTNPTFNFLENQQTFEKFIKEMRLTEAEKHQILIKTQADLKSQAAALSKLMNNLSIGVDQRAIYVSGMLLAMQAVIRQDPDPLVEDEWLRNGLTPNDLNGVQTNTGRDGVLIAGQIQDYLDQRNIPRDKVELMMNSFNVIKQDRDRDVEVEVNDKAVSKYLGTRASANKQVFTLIYETVYKSIDGSVAGHVDIMGEMYSQFLKYALGDGKQIGIVLTPPYVTKLMTNLIGIDENSKVLDLATGSAGFLISAMAEMIDQANDKLGLGTSAARQKIQSIKSQQLMGVELQSQMYTLAATNMILRGDGSSHILKGDSFSAKIEKMTKNFNADHLLLNPPFSYSENGMPFLQQGLKYMQVGGRAAIIIQDSAGSGRAVATNQQILKNNRLIASIKMPGDTFAPNAGVQTSIYVFEAGVPHDFDQTVRFIDFRNDGYKRTGRGTKETDNPKARYEDILKIFKAGERAKVEADWGKLKDVVVDDFIDQSGADWNFEKHQVIDTTVTMADFEKVVGDYMSWQVAQKLEG